MNADRLRPWQGRLAARRISRLPAQPEPGNGNGWVVGRCWFWCGRESARVLWIGSATTLGVSADVFACTACIRILGDQIIDSQIVTDAGAGELRGLDLVGSPPHRSHGPPSGRHRRLP